MRSEEQIEMAYAKLVGHRDVIENGGLKVQVAALCCVLEWVCEKGTEDAALFGAMVGDISSEEEVALILKIYGVD